MGVQTRLVVLYGEFGPFLLAAGQNRAEGKNNRAGGVPSVPLGSLQVIRRRRLDQWIPFGNPTVLGFPPFFRMVCCLASPLSPAGEIRMRMPRSGRPFH